MQVVNKQLWRLKQLIKYYVEKRVFLSLLMKRCDVVNLRLREIAG